ncbi:PIR protein [Plasmodium vivax]|nr:PIR protein [Plasmodium vivax]
MSLSNRRSFNFWQRLEGASCYNNYHTYKTEIQEKIDECYRTTNQSFYTQWKQLYKYINDKNNEIKSCARKNGISLDLFADDKIKSFSILCPNVSYCRRKPQSIVKNHASLQPAAKGTCKKGEICQQKNTRTKSPKVKTQSTPPRESSNAISSPSLETKNPVEAHTESKESKQPFVPSHAHQDPKHHGSPVQTEGGSSESLSIHNPTKPELEQALAQSASLLVPATTTELSTHQISHSPRSIASEEPDASGPPEEIGAKGSTLQSGIPADQTSDDNLHSLQSITGITDGIQDLNDQIFPAEIEGDLSPGKVLFSTEVGGQNPARTSTGDDSSSIIVTACTDTDKTNIYRASICDKTSIDAPTNRKTPDDEAASGVFVGGERAINAGILSAENDNEIDTNNGNILGTLSGFFKGIPNNPQIIKTSAPIGIALLLGLLFKFTPLWRVLTKKNSKKGASIHEELNSVIQEPSIVDDERSIPFSYGAFEYSTFDQNSY